jgi:hypothetical protein
MKRASSWAIVIALVTVGLLTVGQAYAEEEQKDDALTCSLETLKGRYLFATSGTVLPPAFGVTEPTPGASNGFEIFNGDGTGTGTVTLRVGTQIVLENAVVPITYTVKADCTGSYTVLVPNGPSFDLFIAPNGEAISVISTAPPGNYVSSIDRRVSRE